MEALILIVTGLGLYFLPTIVEYSKSNADGIAEITMDRKNAYVKLLEDAKKDLDNPEGVNYNEFLARFDQYGIKQSPYDVYSAIYQSTPSAMKLHMSMDAYFRLLEYEELKLALNNSMDAKRQARLAIWITAVLGLIQCVMAGIQILGG